MELLTVTGLADETGISRQAMHKHLSHRHISADYEVNGMKLFKPESVDKIKDALLANRLQKNRKPQQ
jgi:hypothetical protein